MKKKFYFIFLLLSLAVIITGCGKEEGKEEEKKEEEETSFFFNVEDIVINPAGTNAQRVMIVSLALQVQSEEEVKTLEERKALVQDIVNNSLSSKNIETLTLAGYKDSLKLELKHTLKARLPKSDIRNVYFTKYIIQ